MKSLSGRWIEEQKGTTDCKTTTPVATVHVENTRPGKQKHADYARTHTHTHSCLPGNVFKGGVCDTCPHSHTDCRSEEERGSGEGGLRQDKQSSKKHSSDPLSWWVAGSDAAAQRRQLVFQKSFTAIVSARLSGVTHWRSCWTFLTKRQMILDQHWHRSFVAAEWLCIGCFYAFKIKSSNQRSFSSKKKSSLTGTSTRIGFNDSFSLRVKRSEEPHTQSAAQLANHGKLKLAGSSATPSCLTLESATALNAWMASVFWPTPNRGRPQDTHTGYRHVPHIHRGRGNNKYQTQVPPTSRGTIKTGSTATHTCERYCIDCQSHCLYS